MCEQLDRLDRPKYVGTCRCGTIELAGRLSPQLVKIQRGSIESQSESQQMKSFPRDRMFSVVIAILHSINQITNYQLNVKR